jgi:Fe-S oxidoreductase
MSAHLFGFIDRWSRWAGVAPGAVNYLSQHEPFASWIKGAAGIARERRLPLFARRSFTDAFRKDNPRGFGERVRGEVLLWPDTFNNHFHPQVAQAAIEVLRYAGWRVRIPKASVCCGRPLYEFGLLDDARRYLERTLAVIDEELHAGLPVIVLEPACLSVFREELPMMLPRHEQARRLKAQSFLLSDFLLEHSPSLSLQPLARKAVVHMHCHHKSVLRVEAEREWLHKLGIDAQEPEAGCCGMAGSFGFEARKYDVSMKCAERALLPAVQKASGDDLVVADGYSCREQIAQGTRREALHLAQVMRMAMPGSMRK